MRHGKRFNHLGRKKGHREAMLNNMASSLIMHKRIFTTTAKAKALRKFVEPLITKSKDNTTHSRRVVFSYLQDKSAVDELYTVVAPKVGDRPGGYTRILKTHNRLGDNAEMCMMELVDFNEMMLEAKEASKKAKGSKRTRRGKKPAAKAAAPEAPEAPKAEEVVEEAVTQAEDSVEEKVEAVAEEVEAKEDVVEETTEKVEDAVEAAEEKAEDVVEEVKAESEDTPEAEAAEESTQAEETSDDASDDAEEKKEDK